MQHVPDGVLEAARWVAGYSTVEEPEWSLKRHAATLDLPAGVAPEDVMVGQGAANAELWEQALGGLEGLEGSTRDWFDGLRSSLDELARALDASGLTRRHGGALDVAAERAAERVAGFSASREVNAHLWVGLEADVEYVLGDDAARTGIPAWLSALRDAVRDLDDALGGRAPDAPEA